MIDTATHDTPISIAVGRFHGLVCDIVSLFVRKDYAYVGFFFEDMHMWVLDLDEGNNSARFVLNFGTS